MRRLFVNFFRRRFLVVLYPHPISKHDVVATGSRPLMPSRFRCRCSIHLYFCVNTDRILVKISEFFCWLFWASVISSWSVSFFDVIDLVRIEPNRFSCPRCWMTMKKRHYNTIEQSSPSIISKNPICFRESFIVLLLPPCLSSSSYIHGRRRFSHG